MLRRFAVRSLKKNFFPVLLFAALAAVTLTSEARAFCRMRISGDEEKSDRVITRETCQSSGIALYWNRRCISYAVTERVRVDTKTGEILGPNEDPPYEEILEMVDASFKTWTSVTCNAQRVDLEVKQLEEPSECSEAQQNLDGPNVNSVAFVWDWDDRGYDDNAFAVTSVFANAKSGEILGVDMELNETQGNLGNCCPNGPCTTLRCSIRGIVDIQNVITHEAGHFFGLGHSNLTDATMYSQASVGETSKRVLKSDDTAGLCSIYPPGSLPDDCNYKPPGGLSMACQNSNSSSAWGCSVHNSALSRSNGRVAWLGIIGLWALFAIHRRAKRVPPNASTSTTGRGGVV